MVGRYLQPPAYIIYKATSNKANQHESFGTNLPISQSSPISQASSSEKSGEMNPRIQESKPLKKRTAVASGQGLALPELDITRRNQKDEAAIPAMGLYHCCIICPICICLDSCARLLALA